MKKYKDILLLLAIVGGGFMAAALFAQEEIPTGPEVNSEEDSRNARDAELAGIIDARIARGENGTVIELLRATLNANSPEEAHAARGSVFRVEERDLQARSEAVYGPGAADQPFQAAKPELVGSIDARIERGESGTVIELLRATLNANSPEEAHAARGSVFRVEERDLQARSEAVYGPGTVEQPSQAAKPELVRSIDARIARGENGTVIDLLRATLNANSPEEAHTARRSIAAKALQERGNYQDPEE